MTARETTLRPNQFARYQVKVQGQINGDWIHNFQSITAHFDGEVTTLNGIIADQSALRGLLCSLWDFNLTVLSVVLDKTEENERS